MADSADAASAEDAIATRVAKEIRRRVEEEGAFPLVGRTVSLTQRMSVEKYVLSSDFSSMVEAMKRRERERMMREIESQIRAERDAALAAARESLQREVRDQLLHREILAENQKKIEVCQSEDEIVALIHPRFLHVKFL